MTVFFATTPYDLSGIYNIGSGMVTSWNTVAKLLFKAMNIIPNIKYIDMPESLQKQYQYFTCLDIQKIRMAGYDKELHTIENAVIDYVKYLKDNKHLGEEND
jgi:ADP-L-glycero-D-manno-heptose 6-epimerase